VRIGAFEGDLIRADDEPLPANGRPLLRPVMEGGNACALPDIAQNRALAAANVAALPERHRALEGAVAYPVAHSPRLVAMRERAVAEHGG
jgi:hypothetical protein